MQPFRRFLDRVATHVALGPRALHCCSSQCHISLLCSQAEYTRSPEGMRVSGLDPAWVHANYRVGHAAKREFLRDRLVWRAEEAMILSGGAGRGSGGGYPVCPASADGIMPIPEEEFPAPNEGTLPETELQPLRLGEGTPA